MVVKNIFLKQHHSWKTQPFEFKGYQKIKNKNGGKGVQITEIGFIFRKNVLRQ